MLGLPTQHKLGIPQGFIVQQPVQFCPLSRGAAIFVLNDDAVDGKGDAILEPGLYPVGVHVVAVGKQFWHSGILLDLILMCGHSNQYRRMTGVALHRFEVTVRLQQLIGGTGMPQTVEHDLLKFRVLCPPQSLSLLRCAAQTRTCRGETPPSAIADRSVA